MPHNIAQSLQTSLHPLFHLQIMKKKATSLWRKITLEERPHALRHVCCLVISDRTRNPTYTLMLQFPSADFLDRTIISFTILYLRVYPKKAWHLLVGKRFPLCHFVSRHCSRGCVVRSKPVLAPQLPQFSSLYVIFIQHLAGGAWRHLETARS